MTTSRRSPYDGQPFYCALCGAGFGEYMACEEPDCELETKDEAEKRRLLKEEDDETDEG